MRSNFSSWVLFFGLILFNLFYRPAFAAEDLKQISLPEVDINERVKSILGIDLQELKSCQKDEDCISTQSFLGCCTNLSINKKYQNIVDAKRKILWNELNTAEDDRRCSLIECTPPQMISLCRGNVCILARPNTHTAHLKEAEVLNISNSLMFRNALDPEKFSPPHIVFNGYNWILDYMSIDHNQKMQKFGKDTVYKIEVNDNTGEARFSNYILMNSQ